MIWIFLPSSLGVKYRLIISNEELTFSRRFQKSRKDAKSGRVILKQSLRLSGKSSSSGSYVLPPPLSQRITSRQGALRLHYVDLYPFWTSGQTEKCEFWQLLLWALTSRDSFSPRPHPRSDFPTSAIIYWQELFLFLRLKELPSAILNKTKHRAGQSDELNHHFLTPPALPRVVFSPPSSLIFEDAGSTNHLQTLPIVPLSARNKGKSPSAQPRPSWAAETSEHCSMASHPSYLFEINTTNITWC